MKRSVIKAVSYFLLLFLLIGVMPTIPAASPAGETENDIAIVEDSNDIENDMEYELEAESDEETGIAGDETVPDTAEDGLSIETPDDLPADTDQEAAFDEAEPESSGRYEGDGLFSFTGDGSGTLEDPYIVTNEDHFKEVCDIPGIHFRLRITPPTFAPFAAFRAFRMSMYSGGGSGTIEDPYLVSNVEQLDEIRNDLSAHYKLTADIDLEGGFIPIAHNAWAGEGFTGSIDGDGHVIRGLLPFGSDFIGLIGYAEHGAILKNLTIENVTAHGSFAGSLVGYAQGITIENCFVIGGEVYGSYYAGGLVGYAEHIDVRDSAVTGVGINGMYAGGLIGVGYDMAVSESYATGNIYGGFYAGGLVGYMDSSVHIENCFALVGIESYSEYAAGLVGYSFGNIVNSYSASAEAGLAKMDSLANPSTVTNSYYLEMSDDWRGPWSGEARTEEEMKQRATFSGWDFDDVWAINEGVNMPYLRGLPNPFGDEEAIAYSASIAVGMKHIVIVDERGIVSSWGQNKYGQLGNGTTAENDTPALIDGLNNIASVSSHGYHTVALTKGGDVWSWGYNYSGQIGDTSYTNRLVPVQISGINGAKAISAGYSHSLAATSEGSVYAWGYNGSGQLGSKTEVRVSTPSMISDLTDIAAVAAGGFHSLALKSDGTVWAWGDNTYGQLGNGTTNSTASPVQVSGLTDVIQISAGGYFSLALKSDGTVYAWGWNGEGQLGNDAADNISSTPVMVYGLSDVSFISAGGHHSLALKADGQVWGWGYNGNRQLQNDGTFKFSTPIQITTFDGSTSVTAGDSHTYAVHSSGEILSLGA